MQWQEVQFEGWRCAGFLNDGIEAFVMLDAGPRVIGLRRVGADNVLYIKPETRGTIGGEEYCGYGGHRLWTAPEVRERTNEPDNAPVVIEGDWFVTGDSACGLERAMSLEPIPGGYRVHHRIRNTGTGAHNVALWGITVMRAGGVCSVWIDESRAHGDQVLPRFPLVFWPYTHWGDHRMGLHRDRVTLAQSAEGEPTKFGVWSTPGVAEYRLQQDVFTKKFSASPGDYPDFGCNFEAYTRHDMLEVESLGPLVLLKPGETATHVEHWTLTTP